MLLLLFLLLLLAGGAECAFLDPFLVELLEEVGLEAVISLFEVGDQPVYDALQCHISHKGLLWLAAQFGLALGTLVAIGVLLKIGEYTPFAV